MPAAKHRKGLTVRVYLSPEHLDLLAIADNPHAGTHAKLAILDAIEGKLDRVDREYVKRAAQADELSLPEWCRQTLLRTARKRLGLPEWEDMPSAGLSRPNVASKPVGGPVRVKDQYNDHDGDSQQREIEQNKYAKRQQQAANPELAKAMGNMDAFLAANKEEIPT